MVSTFWKNKYDKEANRFWDRFYKSNKTKFFKDRHWILREFPFLQSTSIPESNNKRTLLDVVRVLLIIFDIYE